MVMMMMMTLYAKDDFLTWLYRNALSYHSLVIILQNQPLVFLTQPRWQILRIT